MSIIDRKYIFRAAEEKSKEVLISYNELIEILIDFTIFTLTIFIVIKFINRFKRKAEDPKNKVVETPKNIELLSNIESFIKEQNTLLKSKK